MVTWSRPYIRVGRSEFASAAGAAGTRRLLLRALGRRGLRLVDFRLVRRLRRLEAGRRVGEHLVALLVLLGLAAGGFRALARHFGFARARAPWRACRRRGDPLRPSAARPCLPPPGACRPRPSGAPPPPPPSWPRPLTLERLHLFLCRTGLLAAPARALPRRARSSRPARMSPSRPAWTSPSRRGAAAGAGAGAGAWAVVDRWTRARQRGSPSRVSNRTRHRLCLGLHRGRLGATLAAGAAPVASGCCSRPLRLRSRLGRREPGRTDVRLGFE